ncbi:MAG TPA: acylneuraminate cytidylyltransferase family protein [Gammaproteobacteria bacterium]|nr:acylneuraminate cytidylyltransferase family protein [Gammaproteobacteria bacterium]
MEETIAIVPARGGSKSIPKKNIKDFCDKPLIAYSIEVAQACPSITRTIVSTDSEEIAEIAKSYGAEVPFIRPKEFAQDATLDYPVFRHCLEWLRDNENSIPEMVVQLRPTSPIRDVETIERGIAMLRDHPTADCVRAICEPSQNPYKMWTLNKEGYVEPLIKTNIHEQYNQPRQALPVVYWQNGYLDVIRAKTILEKGSMSGDAVMGLVLSPDYVFDIDNDMTFEFAELYYKRKIDK